MAENRTAGIGFWGALALLFIAFKITGYIDWSWWWVTLPLWGPFALFGGVFAGILIAWLIGKVAKRLAS